ncbi:MAG: hypothetical protein QOJ16_1972 [Acidobacteriota bacterium]|jgi:hypothetical protein|nr:hypothetical protein [Acidobacteriota bacterium]
MYRAALSWVPVALLVLAAPAVPAAAEICTRDDVPAATLLLPYFEVDLGNPNGITTLFSVNNAFSDPVVAKVEIWTDLGVALGGFNIYLAGFDVQSINLRDVFNCNLPNTPPPAGSPFSNSCAGAFPVPAQLCSATTYQTALTGKPVPSLSGCAGLDHGDNIARGYVTVDAVNGCTTQFPGNLGYFGPGGTGVASNKNVLWGDSFYVNPSQNLTDGEALVHIEASGTNNETSLAGQYTFYGKFVSWNASDNREPLPSTYGVRFLNGGAFSGGTNLRVWRDSKIQQGAFKCGATPSWYPLGQQALFIFDEQAHTATPGAITPFPTVAQRVHVNGPELPVPYTFGWLILGLNNTVASAGNVPPEDPSRAQAWVGVEMAANGRFSAGFNAMHYDNACTGVTPSP